MALCLLFVYFASVVFVAFFVVDFFLAPPCPRAIANTAFRARWSSFPCVSSAAWLATSLSWSSAPPWTKKVAFSHLPPTDCPWRHHSAVVQTSPFVLRRAAEFSSLAGQFTGTLIRTLSVQEGGIQHGVFASGASGFNAEVLRAARCAVLSNPIPFLCSGEGGKPDKRWPRYARSCDAWLLG